MILFLGVNYYYYICPRIFHYLNIYLQSFKIHCYKYKYDPQHCFLLCLTITVSLQIPVASITV